MTTHEARIIAGYIIDFQEPDGISADLKSLIDGTSSSVDALQQLTFTLDELINGKPEGK